MQKRFDMKGQETIGEVLATPIGVFGVLTVVLIVAKSEKFLDNK